MPSSFSVVLKRWFFSDQRGVLTAVSQRPDEDDLTEYHAKGPHREVEYFFASDARLVLASVCSCF